jgi:hypothetical protein
MLKQLLSKWILMLLLLSPQASFAFSHFGHQLICATAYDLAAPKTKVFIDKLVKTKGVAKGYDFVKGCTWPDVVRKTTHRETDEYHYMNVPKGLVFNHQRDCAAYDCVTQAVQRYALNLADSEVSWRNRKEALFFLGHFVADLHQPLHVGYGEDRGGNTIKVFRSAKHKKPDINLHALWDRDVPYKAGLGRSSSQRVLLEKIRKYDRSSWQGFDVIAWARASHEMAKDVAYVMPDDSPVVNKTRLTEAYYKKASPAIIKQFMKASVRLAYLLDKAVESEIGADSFHE